MHTEKLKLRRCACSLGFPVMRNVLQKMDDRDLIIDPPFYMIGMMIYCWKCQSKMPAIALLSPHVQNTEEQVCILSEIENMPDEIITYIQGRVPTYKVTYSKTVTKRYFANTCPKCGMLSGDFHLHAEPGAPFFPINKEEAKELYMTKIPIDRTF